MNYAANSNYILLSASTITGDKVKNSEGEDLGKIEEIMIDTDTGQVEYYVLSFGGILGMGEKLFAIPPKAMGVDTEEKCMVLNIDKDRLENAPGFDKDNWPDMADESFRNEIYGHYGYEYTVAA